MSSEGENGGGGAEARLNGGLGDGRFEGTGGKVAFREARGAHSGGEHQPGKGFESVIDVEGFEIGVGLSLMVKGRFPLPSLKMRPKSWLSLW